VGAAFMAELCWTRPHAAAGTIATTIVATTQLAFGNTVSRPSFDLHVPYPLPTWTTRRVVRASDGPAGRRLDGGTSARHDLRHTNAAPAIAQART
jgi:hypothetical protein